VTATAGRRRKHWGWGYEDEQLSGAALERAATTARAHLGYPPLEVEPPAPLEAADLPEPSLRPPEPLRPICSDDAHDRARHAHGSSYRDVVRAFRGRFDHPPDLVARPRGEGDLERLLEWAAAAGAAIVPYGGGTSVVGGVEPSVGSNYAGAVSVDLGGLAGLLDLDAASGAARLGAGTSGPALERELRPHGLSMRFYPQSFELSTLGGWVATRAGGHFATGPTRVDDLVESVRALTPGGAWESRRLPSSGAGPSPDRLLLGSEGTLGIITEAWVRVRPRPRYRASATVLHDDFESGIAAVRELARSGLGPSNCRLVEGAEAALTGAGPPDAALLLLGFESADHPLEPWLDRALELCADHGGRPASPPSHRDGTDAEGADGAGAGAGGAEAWRSAFLRAPYVRDVLVTAGVISETIETAITWDRLPGLVTAVRTRAAEAVGEVCGTGTVTCRLTHAYPDGAAPYFTVLAPARRGAELEQWGAIKRAASEAVLAAGGTITHHHAVGRDHRPWYDRQRPEPFAAALRAAKAELDPAGVLNPGVLVDPRPAPAPT
jgi:alkyldihydroxyacetonephosphate synthase